MGKHMVRAVFLAALFLTASAPLLFTANPNALPATGPVGPTAQICPKQEPSLRPEHAYHLDPPTEPLPVTLDPRPFLSYKPAFVAYSIAAKIREVLYQEPCYCPCDKVAGHQSLLDCFTTTHGYGCKGCQSEVFFIYEQSKSGKTPKEIREGMEKRQMWKLDATKYADQHFAEYAADPR